MADNLIFPIGFDLESGVQDAIKKGDAAIRQIQSAMNRKPIVIKAEVDANKFQMFSRQFTNSIDGISAKLAQAQRIWNSMSFDVKFDPDGNLSRRAQVVFDAFQQLTQASATMGQRLGEVNRNLAKSEQDTARAITAEYDKRKRQTDEQIRLKERQAAAEERVRQGQLKGVNIGYVDIQRQVEAVRNLRLQYEAILPMLNAMAQRRVQIKIGIDKQFEADIQRINADIARLRQSNIQLGAKGDTNAIQANLQAIRQLEVELQRISQQKIDLLNSNKINSDLARLRTEVSSVFGELQSAERRLAADNSLNAALDAQSQKVLQLHANIQKLDQQFAQLNATGRAYNQDGSFTAQANTLLQQRIALTKQLEQEAITGQQAQIKLEQQLREEKRKTEQDAKNAAKEAERQAKAEAAARKQAQDAANAENKARQEAYNARRRQGRETQRILNKEAKSIADITAKLQIQQQRLRSTNIGSAKFNKIAEEVRRLTADLEKANQKMRDLTWQTQSGASRQVEAHRQVTQELGNQSSYLKNLLKKTASYWSIHQVGNFITQIREVTAQFELQRVSLGAILQDQNKANQLFSEIKSFALKSPVKILDLTKYTKQLAAYKIGYDELFETTKKLTDVSVGLGVSMDRVVLAYGQVRATGYLRASEVRQFTEMGVPIVEELAAKLSKLNGEAITAADVMELISKRGISFEMVKDVFNDMTSAGGIFYNMQEKQGNTLYGMWAKLGDAASVMYEKIGNTGVVNQVMKWLIELATDAMKHWRFWGKTITWIGGLYLGNAASMKVLQLATLRYTAAGAAQIATSKAKAAAAVKEIYATRNASAVAKLGARMDLMAAAAKLKAATATNVFTASLYKLWAAFLANPLGWVIAIVGTLVALFANADDSAKQFAQSLSEIEEKYTLKNLNDADNFRLLADGALKAAAGSKEQRDKLAELDRTYGDILGSENLQIDKLREMKGEYGSLIDTIKEYNIQMKYSEREGTIKEFYGVKKKEAFGNFEDELSTIGFGSDEVGHEVGATIAINIQDALLEELEKNGKATVDNANKLLQKQLTNVFVARGKSQQGAKQWATTIIDNLYFETKAYVEALNSERNALDANSDAAEKASGKYGKLRKEIETAQKELNATSYVGTDGKGIDEDSFLYQQMVANATMKKAADLIRNSQEMKDALGDKAKELEPEWLHLVDKVNPNDLMNITTVNFDAILGIIDNKYPDLKRRIKLIQEKWGNVAPTNATALQIRNKLIAVTDSFELSMDKMKKYLWDGSGDVDAYLKRLKEQQDELKKRLKEKQNTLLQMGTLSKWWNKLNGKDIEAEVAQMEKEIAALDQQIAFTTEYTIPENRGDRTSDPRLQNLKEEISLYEKLYQEYKQYEKAVGSSKAAEYMNREAKETIDALAEKYGIGLPKNVTDLTSAFEILYKKMQALPSNVFKDLDKELKEFRWKIEKVDIDDSQNKIEQQLEELADRISRTKTAKEFYEKILSQTGDVELAAKVSLQIYGSTGKELDEQIKEQFRLAFATLDKPDVEVSAKIGDLIDKGRYEELRDYINLLPKDERKAAEDLVKAQQQMSVKQYEQWLKDLEKAKDYADKRIELSRYTANQIAAIEERIAKLDPAASDYEQQKAMLEKLIQGYKERESKEAAGLEYEQFKNSALYVQVFENLDNASKTTLENMRNRLLALKDQWKNLNPQQVKELTKRLEELDAQIAQRNPFKSIADSIKKLREMRMSGRTKEGDAQKAFDAEAERQAAKAKMLADEKAYEAAVKQYGAESLIAKVMRAIADDSKKAYRNAEKSADSATTQAKEWQDVEANIDNANDKIDKYQQQINEALDGVRKMMEAFGASDEDMQFFDDVTGALNEIVDAGQQAAMSVANIMSGNPFQIFQGVTQGIGAIGGLVSGITNLFSAGKVRRANKEIKRQQQLLEQLDYTYGRLEKAADKLFGSDYLNNYNKQIKNLQAQQQAYLKQAQAERSKGKKKDTEKIKEYENQARETADKIKELQDDLAAHFTGSSRTDVARQMAKSWIDAKASMSDTFAAIKGDYADMIKNMIVEGAAARVIENALSPLWKQIEDAYKSNNPEEALDKALQGMDVFLNNANNGMEVLWKALEARGYDMKELIGDVDSNYTGIAKNVAGATSEEINTVAAIGNTLMYYVSPIPRMDENLAAIRAIMERGGTSALPTTTSAGWTDWQQQAMDNYQAIARNTAETVVRCERAAVACEAFAADIHRIIKVKGATQGINVFMN